MNNDAYTIKDTHLCSGNNGCHLCEVENMMRRSENKYRFIYIDGIAVKRDGLIEWVQYEDYKRLKTDYEKLKAELIEFKSAIRSPWFHI